ncbi:hypothetical protein DIPPA_33443 [Diplonema papillatum]|nr:hypothetical protein DIPPA_27378 [Diplonema papillatum]KAJ9457317.1 hypothetical protein DIPPA_33443 [Diplonema papillatum]
MDFTELKIGVPLHNMLITHKGPRGGPIIVDIGPAALAGAGLVTTAIVHALLFRDDKLARRVSGFVSLLASTAVVAVGLHRLLSPHPVAV